MHSNQAALVFINVLIFGSSVFALPQGIGVMPLQTTQCSGLSKEHEFKDIKQEDYDGEPELVTGTACMSPCTITKAYTWSKSTTFSASMGTGPAAKATANGIWKFLAGGFLNPGYSWTTTKGEMTSSNLDCPFDTQGVACGVQVVPRMAHVTGQMRKKWDSPACNGLNPELNPWVEIEVRAPLSRKTWSRMSTAADAEDDIAVTFSACITDCNTVELCKEAQDKRFPLCPQVMKPKHWDQGPDVLDLPFMPPVQDVKKLTDAVGDLIKEHDVAKDAVDGGRIHTGE